MSTCTLVSRAVRSKISAIAVAALLLGACAVEVAEVAEPEVGVLQEALTTHVYPPTGWSGVRVYIGSDGSDAYVYYRQNLSGAGTCGGKVRIGTSPGVLTNRTRVHGSGGGDELRVIYGSETFSDCAGEPTLTDFLGGGSGKLELYGDGGDDIIYDPHPNPNLQMYGGPGADQAQAGQAYIVDGESGADKLILMGNESSPWSSVVDSGNDADLLCAYGNKIFDMNGGAGTDKGWYAVMPQNFTSVESVPFKNDCDAARTAISNRIFD